MYPRRPSTRALFLFFLLCLVYTGGVVSHSPEPAFVSAGPFPERTRRSTTKFESKRYRGSSDNTNFHRIRRSQTEGNSKWTSRLTTLNIGMFALQGFYPGVTRWGIKLSDRILRGQELHRLITPAFLHADVVHLYSNTHVLMSVGPALEKHFGSGRFLATYLVSGVAGNFLSALQSPIPALGASSSVFGILGAYLAFMEQNKAMFGQMGDRTINTIVHTVGINLVSGFMSARVDNWGHIGGFLGGVAMALLFGPRYSVERNSYGKRVVVDRPMIRLPAFLGRLFRRRNRGNRY